MAGYSIAHVSDLHLPLAERPPRMRDLLSKRLLSWLSWRRSRRFIHRPEILARLMADVAGDGADHLAVTGDLTNLALPEEFDGARDWLAAQGGPGRVTAIPGNHDALVPVSWDQGLARWSEWMGEPTGPARFPTVKRLGPIALVGVSSAVPTAPFLASGTVGAAQLRALDTLLRALAVEGLFRIVLVHHPVTDGAVSRRKALGDRAALRETIRAAGAELVLHGHSHQSSTTSIAGPEGPIPVIGAPSASADPNGHGAPAGWRRIEVIPSNEAWRVVVSTRTMQPDGSFLTADDLDTSAPRPGGRSKPLE